MKKANFFDFNYINKAGIKSNIKKINAIIISLLLVIFNFALAFNLALIFSMPNANAQQYGWCLETNTGKTCHPSAANTNCKQPYHTVYQQRPSDCREVTCIVDGNCMQGVPYKTCIDELNGNPAQPNAPECVRGCCGIAGRSYGVMTQAQCQELAEEKGFSPNEYMEFYGGLINETECSLKFAGKDRGCCVGQTVCSYRYRDECTGNFFKDTYCYQIPECNVQPHFKLSCGVMNGDENKICWFDSAGNQEECIENCDYPAFICQINQVEGYKLKRGEIGYYDNDKNGEIDQEDKYTAGEELPVFAPYCKSTTCDLSDAKKSQKLEWENGELKIKWIKPPSQLPSGHSICYNFYTVEDKESETVKVLSGRIRIRPAVGFGGVLGGVLAEAEDFPARSTGLQNQILRCINGRIEIDGLGPDRNLLCFENTQELSTYTEKNMYEECGKCGKTSNGILETIGDFFRAGNQFLVGFGGILGSLGSECNPETCEEIGKYQNGESWCVFRSEIGRLRFGRLGWGSYVDSACMPRYPPGRTDTCAYCGQLGDPLFDFCEKQEAYAIGDCQFQPYGFVRRSLLFAAYAYMLTWSIKFNLIPYYTLVDTFYLYWGFCTAAGVGLGTIPCLIGKWVNLIGEELGQFIAGPVKDIFKGGSFIYSFLNIAAQSLINEITSQITGLK